MRPMSFKSFAIAAALFAGMAGQMSVAQDLKGDVQAGEKKIAMCIGCHGIVGYQASFPAVYKVPMISGQGAKYIANALNAYKSGERKHPTMRSVALGLTPQDIADVSAYYELHGNTLPAPEQIAPAPAKVAELLTKGYLYMALKSYKEDGSSTWGRSNAVMGGVAKQYTLAELKMIADYLGSQQGELKVVPQSKFR